MNTKKRQEEDVFNYSEYLRDYYNRLASGKERVPSDAELSLFWRRLGRLKPLETNVTSSENEGNDLLLLEDDGDHIEQVKLIA